MKKRWIGYGVWLLLAAGLYFFENNTGTRIVLLCSLLFPFLPPLRSAFFTAGLSHDEPRRPAASLTVTSFSRQETDEPGGVRPYRPGDPVSRVHWKLSAKKDELLIREPAAGPEPVHEERTGLSPLEMHDPKSRKLPVMFLCAALLLCAVLLILIPEANRGARALCNRLFTVSESMNAYTYRRFPVPENQPVLLSACFLMCMAALLLSLTVVLRSSLMILGIMASCALFQVYFGLAFPAWINIPLFGAPALWMISRPSVRLRGRESACFCLFVVLVSLATVLLLPGVDTALEEASEKARDHLSRIVQRITGTVAEMPDGQDGETETRHVHTRSLVTGDGEARADQEFRLVTVEEEQISMPHWTNWIRIILLLLLAVAAVTLPFVPFLLLNARKKKARESRKAFADDSVSVAVRAVFQHIIRWLEAAGCGGGNCLYRDWSSLFPPVFPEGYAGRFALCAADFEEAAYSSHDLPEQKRQDALALLKETETALWKIADRKQRFLLKYWMCMLE